jgi:hypothetical protein
VFGGLTRIRIRDGVEKDRDKVGGFGTQRLFLFHSIYFVDYAANKKTRYYVMVFCSFDYETMTV